MTVKSLFLLISILILCAACGSGSSSSDSSSSSSSSTGGGAGGVPPVAAVTDPAVAREGIYFGFDEQFNRYYTDSDWTPAEIIYVSSNGSGSGASYSDPTSVADGMSRAVAGTQVYFASGTYNGCYEFDSSQNGTYDDPIVLYGERDSDGSLLVNINCCGSGRHTCINLEGADYVAIDGFEFDGGYYGVRSVGLGYAANEHQKGVAVLNSVGHDQYRDPFFTGQSDWFVIEACTAYDAGTGDGHGIYLSNGSDWNIARFNETYNTESSDFQINADPISTCEDEGIAYDDPECDAVAGSHITGGRGASDFMLIDSNFFHHSLAQGPNMTSVRNSMVRNNIFALPARHGISFWQETNNPLLGSSNNMVVHNLMVTSQNYRHSMSFTNNSTNNHVENNVFVAVNINGGVVTANASGTLLNTDSTTVAANTFVHNAWVSGFFESEDSAPPYVPNAEELRETAFNVSWFTAFPTVLAHDPDGFSPTATAPWLDFGDLLIDAPYDREGNIRTAPVDLGPFER